ncbi:unnamed protein product [Pleuronectes platessa]|uniref:Uncharacterized protein n=1 Tax=Pleuronectes platessa TaxID=8262 RepID=A0A9N7YUW8_PLEPL|nr:unnamed protein product [Pleuronectes platessa]
MCSLGHRDKPAPRHYADWVEPGHQWTQELGPNSWGAIQEDVLDAGLPVHAAKGGDISTCPYYAAKMRSLLLPSRVVIGPVVYYMNLLTDKSERNPLMAATGQHRAQIHRSTRQNGRCAPVEPPLHTRSMQVHE